MLRRAWAKEGKAEMEGSCLRAVIHEALGAGVEGTRFLPHGGSRKLSTTPLGQSEGVSRLSKKETLWVGGVS